MTGAMFAIRERSSKHNARTSLSVLLSSYAGNAISALMKDSSRLCDTAIFMLA